MADIKSTDLLQQFASDNYSGICPEAWAAMEAANHGHVSGYGDDPWTAARPMLSGSCLKPIARFSLPSTAPRQIPWCSLPSASRITPSSAVSPPT